MAAVTPLPTLSQIRNWDTEHLSQAARDWATEARQLESTFEVNYTRLTETEWKGQGREAALERAGLDLVKVRGPAGQLVEAALAARYGYDQQNGAKEWALDAVADAEQAGFRPNEDLSVTDSQTGGSAATRAARQAQAQALAAQIRHRAALLVASNQEIATKITAAAGNIGEFSFDEPTATGGPSGGQRSGVIRQAANRTVTNTSPPIPPRADVSNDQWNPGTVQHAMTPAPSADQAAAPPPAASRVSPPSPAVSGGRPSSWLPTARAGGPPPPGTSPGAGAGMVGAGQIASAARMGAGAITAATTAISTPAAVSAQATQGAAAAATSMAHMAQPLANVQPAPPSPTEDLAAQLYSASGQMAHTQTPQPPPPSTEPPQARPSASPAPTTAHASAGSPAPSTGSQAPSTGSGGVQMLGFGPPGLGLGLIPQAPRFPLPLDPGPAPPPPPVPKNMTPEQVRETYAGMTTEELRALYEDLKSGYRDRCLTHTFILPQEQAGYSSCLGELGTLNSFVTELRARGVEILPPGAEPAPSPGAPQPGPPGAEPQPGAPSSPSFAEQARQIGEEIERLPAGTRTVTLADKITGLHLDQQQAAEATDIAAKAAWGETGGIINVPDGTKVILPADLRFMKAMVVHPDGSVTVFEGDLKPFLQYVGR